MIYEVIENVVVNELGIEQDKFRLDALIKKDLELDSTETVAVALALKKHFGIDYLFPKNDVTVNFIVNEVNEKISTKM